jgi:endonuclease G
MRFIIALALALIASSPALAETDCGQNLAFGTPRVRGYGNSLTLVCHDGYAAMHDDDLLIPRWVGYKLTADHTLGCTTRDDKFHAEEQLAPDKRATPSDYKNTGYDKGHQAPNNDFAWSKKQAYDTFSMANMAPQVPGLNRQQWKKLEGAVRTWAWKRGELQIYVVPVVQKRHATIGKNHVAVPIAFGKVVVDPANADLLAFIAPNQPVEQGPLDPWLTTVSDIEESAGVDLPLPDNAERTTAAKKPWPSDLKGWNAAKKKKCSK